MDASKQLKCACANCGQTIEYEIKAIGQIIACPKCGEKSRLPAVQPDPVRADSDEPEPRLRVCPQCGEKLFPRQITCPRCEQRRRKKRALLMAASATVAAVLAVAGLLSLVRSRERARRLAETGPYQIHAVVDGPLPQPKVRTPKSLNDLKIGTFVIQKSDVDGFSRIVGDIENVSDHLHRGVSVELEILDAQGVKIDTLTERIVMLDHGAWHIVAKTADPRAASVRVVGIREE